MLAIKRYDITPLLLTTNARPSMHIMLLGSYQQPAQEGREIGSVSLRGLVLCGSAYEGESAERRPSDYIDT